jgi:hypothetical protein
VRALAADVHRLRRRSDGPTGIDALAQPQTALRCQGSVTVQTGLLGRACCLRQLHTRPGGSRLSGCQQRPRTQHLGAQPTQRHPLRGGIHALGHPSSGRAGRSRPIAEPWRCGAAPRDR